MVRTRRKKAPVKCVICSEELEEPYQQIFDETGEELRLQQLLDEFYSMKVRKDKNKTQALCDHCLNELIEAFDLKQKRLQENNEDLENVDIKVEVTDNEDTPSSEDEYETEVLDEQYVSDKEADQHVEIKEEEVSGIIHDENLFEMFAASQHAKGIDIGENEGDMVPKEENEEDGYITYDDPDDPDDPPMEVEAASVEEDEEPYYVDLKEYKRLAIRSKFEDVVFPKSINCRICDTELPSHVAVLDHTKKEHSVNDNSYSCVVSDKCEAECTMEDLSFHLVFKHYDLEALTVFVQCPECFVRFNNFLQYNKHACHVAKNVPRAATKCETCGKNFRSNKRYRFHQQFHLERCRPMACLICDVTFNNEDTFFEHVKYAHEKELDLVCLACDKTFTSKKNLLDHEQTHKVVRNFKCKSCPKSYLDKQMLKDHEVAYHSKSSPFQCYICGKCLNKKSLLNKHIMSHDVPEAREVSSCSVCGMIFPDDKDGQKHIDGKDHEEEAEIEKITIDKSFACEYCELAYSNEDQLRTHRSTHNKKVFYCHLCPLAYDEYKKLKTHKVTHFGYTDIKKTFPVMRHYLCDVDNCSNSYMHWTSLKSHIRTKHNKTSEIMNCPECYETFDNVHNYEDHINKVHKKGMHICQFCAQVFHSKMALAVHVARKHNTAQIQCDECENSYSTNYDLRRHKQSAHQIFKCETCNKIMKNRKNLIVHQRMVHEKLKRYYCQYCNKGYFNKCDRLEHESTVHVKIKRYKCELCSYSCVYKQSLSIHMRKHRNETPYKCTLCPKSFRRGYALTLHLRRHNDIRDYVCQYCNAAYPIQGILNSHIKTKHPNGINTKTRSRRTIAISSARRKQSSVQRTTTFVDDDDGLEEGIGAEESLEEHQPENADDEVMVANFEIDHENPDDPGEEQEQRIYIISDAASSVILQQNENDHDYIVRTWMPS